VISWWERLTNLEAVVLLQKKKIEELEDRVDDLEETKEGKSAIGFTADDDDPLVVM